MPFFRAFSTILRAYYGSEISSLENTVDHAQPMTLKV